MPAQWTPFAYVGEYDITATNLRRRWAKLHAGDQEAWPANPKVAAAWVLFHRGEFEKAAKAGLKLGAEGVTVANKATCIYANYLEPSERARRELFLQVAQRSAEQAAAEPENANAFYWQAYALARYSQGISVAKALAQGLGGKVKTALETAIALQPLHADAHVALGAFHAEVIDKVGTLIGNMTYGAKKGTSLALLARALELTPRSQLAMMEYANALVMLEGDSRMDEATALYERATQIPAQDAAERLDVEMASSELAD
jgi:tetratricopeptide (TPR) repeat protein